MSTNKTHYSQGPRDAWIFHSQMMVQPSQKDSAVFGRSLMKLTKPATSVIFIWVPLISPHSCRAEKALSAGCCVPLPFPAEGKEQESVQVCITHCHGCLGPAGTLSASKQTGRTQIKYQTMLDLQSLKMERLMPLGQTTNWHQGKRSVKFIFSPFPLLLFVQKFLAVIHSKS